VIVDAKVLLTKLASLGIVVTIDRDKLSCRPASRLTPELRRAVLANKHELAALLAEAAEPAADPAPKPAEPPAETPLTDSGYPASWDEPLPTKYQADAELLLAHQLGKDWLDARADLERLVLSAAERKNWPRIQLAPGVWLLPGKQGWQRYAGNPCTQPDGLVRALEVLHGHPATG
jgi:hypothetical protein